MMLLMAFETKKIAAVFTNVLFVVGVVLMVVGFIGRVSTVAKLVVFDGYPLPYGEDRCAYPEPMPVRVEGEVNPVEKTQEQTARCMMALERERQTRKVEDITRSIGFLVAGGVIVYSFRKRA